MTCSEPARTTTRRISRILVAGLRVVIVAIAAALGYQLSASLSSTVASPIDVLRSEHRGALGEANAVPDGTTVFDDEIPGVAKLDPALLGALLMSGGGVVAAAAATAGLGTRVRTARADQGDQGTGGQRP
jgi:hypothetical protein